MGVRLIGAAYSLTIGNPIDKAVLVAMADSACNHCGLAWPGVNHLERKTELGGTSIRKALAELTSQGLLRARGYSKGGRGRATEYVVLPSVVELSTAPCPECEARLINPSPRGGFTAHKPIATRRVSAKPIASRQINPSRGGDHPSIETLSVTSPNVDPSASPSGAAPPPLSDPPPPRTAAEALQRVAEMTRGIGAGTTTRNPHSEPPGPPSDETAGHQ